MNQIKTYAKKKLMLYLTIIVILAVLLCIRVIYLMTVRAEHYTALATEVQQRERTIKAARGQILDVNGKVIASNKTVCTVSVIYNQVKEPEKVIGILTKELGLEEETVRKKVEKRSSREKIQSNVDKETGDRIRAYNLEGVKVDEDYKRYYPYESLASKVLGFTGGDNQGIIGLEVKYEEYLKGIDGKILTPTDAAGIEADTALEERLEPIAGNNLCTSIDINVQKYAEQIAYDTLETKEANYVSVIVMNPQNGEIIAMVNAPEFDLNNPYELNYTPEETLKGDKFQDALNKMWRNQCINDTYEPGSTFKVITAAAALEEGVVTMEDTFSCPGFRIVDDRRIKCHKVVGHGGETFLQATMNSCNPVFIDVGMRLGVDNFYKYLNRFGLMEKTGIDLPGEAGTIMHKKENVGNVELATMSFGQSFQISPVRYLTTASALINGGNLITPHFAVETKNSEGEVIKTFDYPVKEGIISKEKSETMRYMLEKVVAEGSGHKAYIEGWEIGGKTATSQKLPRNSGKYIASFMAFAPADNPQVIAMIIVDEPSGMYYGGTIVGPLMQKLYENILPYLIQDKAEK